VRSRIYGVRQAALRQIINAPIQGSASDIVKIAMIRVHQFLKDTAPAVHMLLQVHDELLFEGPEAVLRDIAPRLVEIMGGAYDMAARLHVDLKQGSNWEDMTPVHVEAPAAVAAAH
jgi:DNA polymerase-1